MYCVKCGQQLSDGDRFCTRCGAPVGSGPTPQATPVPAPSPVPQTPSAPGPTPASAWSTSAQSLRYAGFWRRLVAALIDGVAVGLLWFVMSGLYAFVTSRILETTAFSPDGVALDRALSLISAGRWVMGALLALVYFAIPEGTRRGASLGKAAMRLHVARTDGAAAGLGRSVLRTALKPLSAAPLMLGFLMAGWNRRKQALHDLLSRSVVLRA